MPPTPYVPFENVLQCEVRFTLNGQKCENITYWDIGSAGIAVAAPFIAAAYISDVWNVLSDSYAPTTVLQELYFTDLTTDTSPTLSFTDDLPLGGTGVLQALPNGAALVLSFRSSARGRSSRGRNYLGGFINTQQTNSVWAPILVDAVEACFNAWREDAADEGYQQVVASRKLDGAWRTVGQTYQVNNAIATTTANRSQRRRNPGIGS